MESSVPHSRGKVVVAMSGGVDSSVAACLLREQGYEVTGLLMRTGVAEPEEAACSTEASGGRGEGGSDEETGYRRGAGTTAESEAAPDRHRGCCSAADAADARAVAGRLGIPFFALNFKDEFDRIIDYFADEYTRGRTPNPCVMCNEHLKFGRLASYGEAVGADFVATGHYARIEWRGGEYRLCRAVDVQKDQSYVLFGISRPMLARTLLPIGGMTKSAVRDEARRLGLPLSEKPDSQDICFVPDRDYARIVRERRPEAFQPGAVLDAAGREIGRHEGIPAYTIGQRRGLGIAAGVPIYVIRIDPDANTVTVGSRADLARDELSASGVRWLVNPPAVPLRAAVKIRYSHAAASATVEPRDGDRVLVHFDEPQFAITPGQAAVFYDDDVVLGGGWID
jgi:tRNA-uridine 2-sulfurtransferase